MPGQDRVYRATRILAAIVVPFLVIAVLVLYFVPGQSGEWFAWPVKPPITAMLMASAYAGGIYFFGSVVAAKKWHTIKAGFIPVTVFASMLGVTTLLHWDKFTPGHIAFIVWAILYFTTPFLVLAVWLFNRRENPGSRADDKSFPLFWRVFFSLQAIGTLSLSVVLFLAPAVIIPLWPWPLTALTARVMAAWFAIAGVLGLEIAFNLSWSAARRLLEAETLSFVMIFIAILRSKADFNSENVVYTGFIIAVALILTALAMLFFQMRNRKPAGS
jgi:hypothetical protein